MRNSDFLFIGLGILVADYVLAQANKPKFIIRKKLPYNFNAQTLPPFGIFIQEEDRNNQSLINHELKHWAQYQKTGALIFYLRYMVQKATYGYDKMPLEIDARLSVGESQYCAENYSECVRNGDAITIYEPDFRKV